MAIVLSSQGIASGAFGTFTAGMGHGTTNYYSAAVLMKLDESGPFDMTTLMQNSGGTVGISGTLPAFTSTPAFTISGTLPAFASTPAFTVSGTPAFTISGTLPAFAATPTMNVGTFPALPAGANAIGSIIGRTSNPSVTPTVTAGAYTAGQEAGALMTFAVGGAGSGILESIRVTCKTVQTTTLKLYIFDTNPTNSTWTDHATAAINVADIPFLRGVFTLASPDSGLGTHTIWNVDGIAASFIAANLYGILVVVGTPTFGSTSDLTVKLGIIDD